MHITYLCNEYPPSPHGGIGNFVRTMATRLASRGHRVSVVGLYADVGGYRCDSDTGVDVHRLGHRARTAVGSLTGHARLARTLRQIDARHPIGILEGTELGFGLLPWLPGCPRVIRMHGGHAFFSHGLGVKPRRFRSWVERRSFSRASHFCAVSRFAAETTSRLLGLGEREIEVLFNPIDTDTFTPMPDVPEERDLICFTGSLREKKGVRQLIQAMPAIVAAVPGARLWLQGADTRDPQTGRSFRETLEQEVPRGLAGRVVFCGPVANEALPRRNAMASALVFPSWMETQGIVVTEGMASGRAVVAGRTGPGPELIEDGVDGLLCDPRDPVSIGGAAIRCLQDPEFRRSLGTHARQTAVERFAVGPIVEKNEGFYERCIG